MAIAIVGGQSGVARVASGTSITRAYGSNVSTGSLLIVVAVKYSGTGTDPWVVGDLTQSAGTATLGSIQLDEEYELPMTGAADYCSIGIYSVIVTSGGSCTFQLTAGAASYITLISGEFTGNWDSSRVEDTSQNGSATDSSGVMSSGDCTSAGAALFIGGLNGYTLDARTLTEDAAYSLIAEEEDGNTYEEGSGIYQIVATGTTDNAEWTPGGVMLGYVAAQVVYKESGGVTGTIVVTTANDTMAASGEGPPGLVVLMGQACL